MKVKTKIFWHYLFIGWRNHRARVLDKKIRKWKDESRYPSQWRIKYVIKHVKKFMKILKIKITVHGYENIPKGAVLLTPNHASYFDPAVIIFALINPSEIPTDFQFEPTFLAKEELKKDRFRGYLGILSSFYVSRTNPREALKQLDEFITFVKNNQKVAIVFPEGKRSKTGEIEEFKSGAFRIAKQGFVPIVPVTINNSLAATDFNRRKWLNIEVIFDKAIKPITFMGSEAKDLSQKVQRIVENNYKKPEYIPIKKASAKV